MKYVLKILKVFLLSFVALGVSAIILGVVILRKPHIEVSPWVVEYAGSAILKTGFDPKWEAIKIDIVSNGFWDKTIQFKGVNLCLSAEGWHGCFGNIEAETRMFVNPFNLSIKTIGPIHASKSDVAVNWDVLSAQPGTANSDSGDFFDKLFRTTEYREIHLDVAHAEVVIDNTTYPFELTFDETPVNGHYDVVFSGNMHPSPSYTDAGIRSAVINMEASLPQSLSFSNLDLKLSGDTKFIGGGYGRVRGTMIPNQDAAMPIKLAVEYKKGRQSASAELVGRIEDNNQFKGSVRGEYLRPMANLKTVRIDCPAVQMGESTKGTDYIKGDINCLTKVAMVVPKFLTVKPRLVPTELDFKILSQFELPTSNLKNNAMDVDAKVTLVPFEAKHLTFAGELVAKLGGKYGNRDEPMTADVTSDVQAHVPDFQALVTLLRETNLAVPAPFNVLAGKVDFAVSGSGDVLNQKVEFPVVLTSALKSLKQRVDVAINGSIITPGREPGVKTIVDLVAVPTDIILVLPNATVRTKVPSLTADKRIYDSAVDFKKAAKVPIAYRVKIDSGLGKPIRLISNLAKDPIPLNVKLELKSNEKTDGQISVESFALNIFRKKASVDHFRMIMPAKPDDPAIIDGKISVDYVDFSVKILIVGTTQEPQIKLLSEPPRPENELISLLLFGQPMNDLDEDETRSVEGMRAAMADRAISLASMYVLASTPVQSVGYNPMTGRFLAKVRLGEGTSLNVGTDLEDYKTIGVRRRLGKKWAVETSVEQSGEKDERSGTVMFEWSNRY